MTIKELYEWAIKNYVEEYDIIITDSNGSPAMMMMEPIINHNIMVVIL